jgi:acyl carrier protein
MTDAIKDRILEALAEVAPEADPGALDPDRPLRDQVDIDSYDYMQFLLGIDERLGVQVQESDYAAVQTLRGLVDYVTARTAAP